MELKEAKKYIIDKYRYLFQNSEYILIQGFNENTNIPIEISEELMQIIEEFLLSDSKIENTLLYIFVEDIKKDKNINERINKIIKCFKKNYPEEKLDIHDILINYARYLDEQTSDLENKKNKKRVLDEYFGLLRYENNGNINLIGSKITIHDYSSVSMLINPTYLLNRTNFVGVYENDFITTIINAPYYEYNRSIFTEEEKQEVYISLHNELPYYLYIQCNQQDKENLNSCNQWFKIDEEKIFIVQNEEDNRYYQICPNCGCNVNIPIEILNEKIINKIEERNKTEEGQSIKLTRG